MYMHGTRLGREGGHLQIWVLGFAANPEVAPLALPSPWRSFMRTANSDPSELDLGLTLAEGLPSHCVRREASQTKIDSEMSALTSQASRLASGEVCQHHNNVQASVQS